MVKASMQRDQNEHERYRVYLEVEAARAPVHNRCSVNVYGKIKCLLSVFYGLGIWGFSSKESACNAGDPRNTNSIPGWGRFPAGGNGNPLHCSCQGKSYGQRSRVGYSPWGRKELDTTE